jgi:hypothetical protein
MAEVILCLEDVPREARLGGNGRIRVWAKPQGASSSQGLDLDAARISAIYYFRGNYYVVYTTDKVDFYRPYIAEQIPPLATQLKFVVKEETIYYCGFCGCEMMWDGDDLFCPQCRGGVEWDAPPKAEKVRIFRVVTTAEEEVAQFAEKLLGVKVVKVAEAYRRSIGGGAVPKFPFHEIRVGLLSGLVDGVAEVTDPVFAETWWDDNMVYQHQERGRFIAVRLDFRDSYGTYATYLLEFEGEPDFSIVEQLEEEERKRREEEKRKREEEERRWLEEQRKKQRELEKWTPEKVVEKAVASLPDWADGVVVYTVVSRTEVDADVIRYLLPVKKSKYNGGYYTSPDWAEIKGIPERALDKFADTVILRNGKAYKAKIGKSNGKYVNIKLAEEVKLG